MSGLELYINLGIFFSRMVYGLDLTKRAIGAFLKKHILERYHLIESQTMPVEPNVQAAVDAVVLLLLSLVLWAFFRYLVLVIRHRVRHRMRENWSQLKIHLLQERYGPIAQELKSEDQMWRKKLIEEMEREDSRMRAVLVMTTQEEEQDVNTSSMESLGEDQVVEEEVEEELEEELEEEELEEELEEEEEEEEEEMEEEEVEEEEEEEVEVEEEEVEEEEVEEESVEEEEEEEEEEEVEEEEEEEEEEDKIYFFRGHEKYVSEDDTEEIEDPEHKEGGGKGTKENKDLEFSDSEGEEEEGEGDIETEESMTNLLPEIERIKSRLRSPFVNSEQSSVQTVPVERFFVREEHPDGVPLVLKPVGLTTGVELWNERSKGLETETEREDTVKDKPPLLLEETGDLVEEPADELKLRERVEVEDDTSFFMERPQNFMDSGDAQPSIMYRVGNEEKTVPLPEEVVGSFSNLYKEGDLGTGPDLEKVTGRSSVRWYRKKGEESGEAMEVVDVWTSTEGSRKIEERSTDGAGETFERSQDFAEAQRYKEETVPLSWYGEVERSLAEDLARESSWCEEKSSNRGSSTDSDEGVPLLLFTQQEGFEGSPVPEERRVKKRRSKLSQTIRKRSQDPWKRKHRIKIRKKIVQGRINAMKLAGLFQDVSPTGCNLESVLRTVTERIRFYMKSWNYVPLCEEEPTPIEEYEDYSDMYCGSGRLKASRSLHKWRYAREIEGHTNDRYLYSIPEEDEDSEGASGREESHSTPMHEEAFSEPPRTEFYPEGTSEPEILAWREAEASKLKSEQTREYG